MKAPEKIYLVPFGKKIIEPLPQEGSLADTIWSSKPYGNSNAGNIEYTRSDAFIEKACEWLEDNLFNYWSQLNANNTNDFIEEFKQSIKGE